MSNLKISSQKQDHHLFAQFEGAIDENSDYTVIDFNGVSKATLNLEKISLINSTGIQRWIAFLKEVPESIQFTFEKCASKVVNQLNQFPGFVAGKKITYISFFAPYYCEACDDDFEILITPQECTLGAAPKAPAKKCPTCGADDIEFDSIEKKYFLFLTRTE